MSYRTRQRVGGLPDVSPLGMYRALVRIVNRSISYLSADYSDIAEWLAVNPTVNSLPGLRYDITPGWIRVRIIHHRRTPISRTTPQEQQVHDEINIRKLGLSELTMAAIVILLISRRIRPGATPCPNYYPPGRHPDVNTEDAIHIAFLRQRIIDGRINGFVYPGATFLWQSALIFWGEYTTHGRFHDIGRNHSPSGWETSARPHVGSPLGFPPAHLITEQPLPPFREGADSDDIARTFQGMQLR